MIIRCIHIVLFLLTAVVYSQTPTAKGYRIEGDEIIFNFNVNDYKKASNDYGYEYDFDDLDIKSVVLSGEFNNWSKEGWRLSRIANNQYELRKKLSDFSHDYLWEFKFVINHEYWAEPSKNTTNVQFVKHDYGFYKDTYNLSFYTIQPNEEGNTKFFLPDNLAAKKVVLTGSFNKWNEHNLQMKKGEKGWYLTLQLPPKQYEYKFIIDGKWTHDKTNNNKSINEFGGYNSVISIKKEADFLLVGHQNAKNVFLAGSFNEWNPEELKMTKTDYGWYHSLNLHAGKHHYKFIIDGNWITDPNNTVKEYDNHGNINSVKMIR